MSKLSHRPQNSGQAVVLDCSECGELLIRTSDRYACCPNGHGKLHVTCRGYGRLQREYKRAKWRALLPVAVKVGRLHGRTVYQVEGHAGQFRLQREVTGEPVTALLNGRVRKLSAVVE